MLIEGASDNDNDSSGGNDNDASGGDDDGRAARTNKKSTGRRDIRLLDIPEERVEILDPALEGKAERIGFEESCLFGRRRGGTIRIVVARATYKITADDEPTTFVTVDKPKEIYERGILAPTRATRATRDARRAKGSTEPFAARRLQRPNDQARRVCALDLLDRVPQELLRVRGVVHAEVLAAGDDQVVVECTRRRGVERDAWT